MSGILYGLGIGPGDPELITLKALRLLRAAPVIAYPAPLDGDSLARRIVAGHLPGGQTEIAIRMPMVAERFPAAEIYDAKAIEIAGHLTQGRDVAVLCEGDPFFYGSFMYLFDRLARAHRVEVVPGVSSLTATAAAGFWPLVSRNDSLVVLPAPLPEEVLEARLREADAAVLMKLGRHFTKVRTILDRLGLAERALYVERASMPDQRILKLADVEPDSVPYFSMILLHKAPMETRLEAGA